MNALIDFVESDRAENHNQHLPHFSPDSYVNSWDARVLTFGSYIWASKQFGSVGSALFVPFIQTDLKSVDQGLQRTLFKLDCIDNGWYSDTKDGAAQTWPTSDLDWHRWLRIQEVSDIACFGAFGPHLLHKTFATTHVGAWPHLAHMKRVVTQVGPRSWPLAHFLPTKLLLVA